jgi:hypothetical protein
MLAPVVVAAGVAKAAEEVEWAAKHFYYSRWFTPYRDAPAFRPPGVNQRRERRAKLGISQPSRYVHSIAQAVGMRGKGRVGSRA